MRILHILDHSIPLHSGYSFRTLAILGHQRLMGWETAHITSPKHQPAAGLEEEIDGFHFYRTLPSGTVLERVPALQQLAVIRALEQRLGTTLPCDAGAGNLRAAPRRRCHDHLRRATQRDRGAGIPERKLTVIPNAVDPERFTVVDRPDPALARQLGLEGKRVLGFIGSFYHYDGLSLLLEALPKMLNRIPDIRLVLAGGGMEEEKLRQQAADSGIADKVIFTGRVPHAEIAASYGLIEILIYPACASASPTWSRP